MLGTVSVVTKLSFPRTSFSRAAIVTCAWARGGGGVGSAAEADELGRGGPGEAFTGQETSGAPREWRTLGRGGLGRTQPSARLVPLFWFV